MKKIFIICALFISMFLLLNAKTKVQAVCVGDVQCACTWIECPSDCQNCPGNPSCEIVHTYDPSMDNGSGYCPSSASCSVARCGGGCVVVASGTVCSTVNPPTYPPTQGPTNTPGGPISTPTPTQPVTPLTPKPKRVFIFFEDLNQNGIWEPSLGEKRLSPIDCSTSPYANPNAIPGFSIQVENDNNFANDNGWHCADGIITSGDGDLGDGGACTGNRACGNNACSREFGDNTVTYTCFGEKKCGDSQFNNQGICNCGLATYYGGICGGANGPNQYCQNGNPYNLRLGPYYTARHAVTIGGYVYPNVTFTMPAGWRYTGATGISSGYFSCSGQTCTGAKVEYSADSTFGFGCMNTFTAIGVLPKLSCAIDTANLTPMPNVTASANLPEMKRYAVSNQNTGQTLKPKSSLISDLRLYRTDLKTPPYWFPTTTPAEFNPDRATGKEFTSNLVPTGIYGSANNQYVIACNAYSFDNMIRNYSFENGTTDWSGYNVSFSTGSCGSNCVEGSNIATVFRISNDDPHFDSNWWDTGENTNGKTFKVTFWARISSGTQTISGIILQRYPINDPINGTSWTDTNFNITWNQPLQMTTSWKFFEGTVTLPSSSPNTESKVRLVLRTPTSPTRIYYDAVTLRYNYYREACSGNPWITPAPPGTGLQDCGPDSRFVLEVQQPTPTPIPGRINVSFYKAESVQNCVDTNASFPANVNGTISTNLIPSSNCPSPNTTGMSCSILNQPANSISTTSTYSLLNLYVNPTPAPPGTGSTYETTVQIPNWIQCLPQNNQPFVNILKTSDFNVNARFGITQNVGSWFQTFGGNVHDDNTNTKSKTRETVTNTYFNENTIVNSSLLDIGLISSASNPFSCKNLLTGAINYLCHPPTKSNWILSNYQHTFNSENNPVTYENFSNKLPNKTTFAPNTINNGTLNGQFSTDGTYINQNPGETISIGANFGSKKLIIFIDGNVYINGDISINPDGFLAILTNGNISVARSVNSISGIFLSDLDFIAENGTNNDTPLNVTGTVIARNVQNLRQFQNNILTQTQPTLKFIFNPALILNMPEELKHQSVFSWQEVAK